MGEIGPFQSDIANIGVGGAGWLISLVWTVRALWRRFSRDRRENALDRGEESILDRALQRALEAEERVDVAYTERNEALQREAAANSVRGGLEAELRNCREQAVWRDERIVYLEGQLYAKK